MYSLVDDELESQLADPSARERWLILDRHPDFPGHWIVEGFTNDYIYDLGEIIGTYRALAPAGLERFLEAAERHEYKVAFFEDPVNDLAQCEDLNRPPEVTVNSTFDNTVNGMLPYQVQGYNMLKDLEYGVARWDTGTGKTVLASALASYGLLHNDFDLCFFVVKKNNKVNTVRKLKKLSDVTALYIRGSKRKREEYYAEVRDALKRKGRGIVLVLNYEQFKTDFVERKDDKLSLTTWGETFFPGLDLMVVWDEMPIKLKTRTSELYKSICKCLYRTDPPQVSRARLRPRSMKSIMLSATPIENSPEDWFNCCPLGTHVQGIAAIHSAYRVDYEGPLIEIVTAGATKLTIGPNHPVLTSCGWIKAQDLRKGDKVFSRAVKRASSAIEYFDQPEALIEDVFDALSATTQRFGMKRACPFEFHGDGRYFKSEVHIVGANSLLRDSGKTIFRQEDSESNLSFTLPNPESALLGARTLDLCGEGVSRPQTSFVGFDDRLGAAVGCTWANSNIHFPETVGNGLLANTKVFSDLTARDLILHIAPPNLVQRQSDTRSVSRTHGDARLLEAGGDCGGMDADVYGELPNSFSRLVAMDEIIDVKTIDYSGQIYDLSTNSGTYYAEGLVVSNCVRLMDGGQTYGTVSQFNDVYVKSWNFYDPTKPYEFHNFERMRLKAAHFIHQVSKSDPDIAAVFPKAVDELLYVDWDERTASLYNAVQDLAAAEAKKDFKDIPIFSLIGTLQMVCDAPAMVLDSAGRREAYEAAQEAWEAFPQGRAPKTDGSEFALQLCERLGDRLSNIDHPKLEKLRELLLERHPFDQVVLFTKFNQALMPYLEAALTEWGVSYARYVGTERQQQAVQDAFQAGDIRVFLTSDTGSDSIDLDAGNVVIDYDLPWKWTTVTQRHNRVHRPTSSHETVYYYTMLMEGSVEERVLQIIEKKRGYHNELFDPASGEPSTSARLTKEELIYVLTGR